MAEQREAEYEATREFLGFLEKQTDSRPGAVSELKSAFAQFQKLTANSVAKEMTAPRLFYRLAGMHRVRPIRHNDTKVTWMPKTERVPREANPNWIPSQRHDAIGLVREILAAEKGPVSGVSVQAQYAERTGRKLVLDINHDNPRRFFQKNLQFIVTEDPKDKQGFLMALSAESGKRGSGEYRGHGHGYKSGYRGEGHSNNSPQHYRNGSGEEEEEEEDLGEERSGEPLPPPSPLPEGTSWSRVAAGEKVAKPKADLQKQLSPRLDADDKSVFPPLGSKSGTATPLNSSVGQFREEEHAFKPIVAAVDECEQACGMLREARELAVLFKSAVGQEDRLSLVQVASSEFVFLFDMLSEASGQFKSHGLGSVLENPAIRLLLCDATGTVKMMKRAGFVPREVMDVRFVYQELLGEHGDLGNLIALVAETDTPYVKKQARYWMNRPLSSEQRELASLEATSLFDAMQKLQDKATEAQLEACLAKSMHAVAERNSGDRVSEKKPIQRFISAPLAKSAPGNAAPGQSGSVTKILHKEPAAAVAANPVPQKPLAAQMQPQAALASAGPQAHAVASVSGSAVPVPPASTSPAPTHQQQLQQNVKPASPPIVASAAVVSPAVGRFLAASPLNISGSGAESPHAVPVADTSIDFAPIFAVLPPTIAQGIVERVPDFLTTLHSIVIDVGQPVTITRLYQEPPLRLSEVVSEQDMRHVCEAVGAVQLLVRESAAIGESLHIAHAILDPQRERVTGLTIRVGRAVVGASDVLHDIIVSGKNVILLGFGKTTLLRDIVARRALSEQHVVMVVDTRGELGGLRVGAHPSLGHMRRVLPGPEGQTPLIRAAIEKHAAKVLAIDELWAQEDFMELRSHARIRGVQVIAGCPARDAAEFQALRPVADFDTVVQVLSPVSFRVSYLAAKTTQLRMRTPQGVVIRDESV